MTILVLSDDVFRREGCALLFSGIFKGSSIFKINSLGELWRHLPKAKLILFDICAKTAGTWEEILTDILQKNPAVSVCLLANFDSNEKIGLSFELGAKGYLQKDGSLSKAEETIRCIASGKTVIPDILWAHKKSPSHPLLTPKQLEIMTYLSKGNSNKGIADSLGLSVGTVKRHISNIFAALGAKNRLEAVNIYKLSVKPIFQ